MDVEQGSFRITVATCNLCIIGPGGNLRYQGPIFVLGTITSLVLAFGVARHLFLMSAGWSTLFAILATPLICANVSMLIAVLIAVLIPSLHEQYKHERIQEYVAQSAQFDVLCIQECINLWFSSKYQDELLQSLREVGFLYYAETPPKPKFPAMLANSGLLIVSKVPIVSYQCHIYSRQAWYDIFAVNRAALYAEIATDNNTRLHVFTTHLAPGAEAVIALMNVDNKRWNLVALENSDALVQTDELMQFIKESTKNCVHKDFVLAGDLNFRGGSASYNAFSQKLADLGLDARDIFAKRENDGALSWPATFGCVDERGNATETLITRPTDQCRPKTLDYVFSNVDFVTDGENAPHTVPYTVVGKPFKQVSDHQGLAVTFIVPKRAAE